MQNVSFSQIVEQLYKVFSNEAEASQYTNTQSGAQYMGLCGWAGTMSPLNRAAFVDTFGQDVTDRAEAEARARVAEYRAAYEASEYHRHELEAGQADPDQVPAVGSFVFACTDWLKCDGGPMDPLKNHVNDWGSLRPELVEIAAVVEVEPAEFLSAETAHRIAREHQNHGGSRYNEADPLRLDGQPYAWTVGVLVVCRPYGDGEKSQLPARWYIVDSEGFGWARYILMPQRFASMYAEEIADLRAQRAAVEAQKEAEEQAAKAARLAEYRARCARWEGAGLVDVRPLIAAEEYANKAHGWRSAEAKSAARKLAAARRRNILTMCQAAAPGVKFSVKKWDGWGGSYEVSWTDGPTADSLKAAADLDLLEEGRDTFDGMTDCAGHERAEFVEFSKKYLAVFGEINTERETSPEFRAEIIARIREAVPGLPEGDQVRIDEAQAWKVADAAADISGDESDRRHVADMAERYGLREAAHYVARVTSRPTTSEAPTDPTPDNGGTGAAYGESEKSQNQEAPDGLTLEEIPGGVAVVGDSRATYKARRDIKAHGARWNKAAQRWEATDPEAVESLRKWLTTAPVSDATPTEEAAPVAYGEAEKSQPRTPEAEAINAALVVVDGPIMRNLAFINDAGELVTNAGTAALLHPSRGFVVMPDDDGTPYTPLGGAEALREILQAGGFLNFEGFRFVWPVDFDAPAMARLLAAYGMPQKSPICEDTEAAKELEAEMMAEAIAHHVRLKQQHPDALLLLRCGDFYELWFSDAEIGADVLRLTLTRRPDGVPICAFPYMALDTYLPKLVRAGHRVAICDDLRTKRRPRHQEATA